MNLLLDTHIFLWCEKDDRRLSKEARALINNAAEIYVSSISILEASIKRNLGKLDVDPKKLIETIEASGFLELPFTVKHAAEISRLPDIHRDPFDRMLIAQALSEPLKFLTADKALR